MDIIIKNTHKSEYTYQKRRGTSGIKGQLYETKLITLIRIRSFVKEYDQFYLGTSLDGVGALDDICVRYKRNNEDVVVFLQAKHRTEDAKGKLTGNDLWKPTGDFSLLKYFDSYLKVRQRFKSKNISDVMFNGKYEDMNCYLIIYTSAGNELKDKKIYKDHSIGRNVRDLIQSGDYTDIFQYRYSNDEVDLLTTAVLVEEMKCLGKSIHSFITKNKFDMMLNDYYIRKYHVVLARSVINVSAVNNAGHRIGTFRDDFLKTNDELLVVLKEVLFDEAVQGIKSNRDNLKELVEAVVLEPTAVNLGYLIQTVSICYNQQTNILTIPKKTDKDVAQLLSEVKIKYNIYKEARDIAVEAKLNSFYLKLPATFGNIDIAVSGGRKSTKRLKYLAGKLEKIMSQFKNKNVVINDELIGPNKLVDEGVMDINGGLGSAVGNLLIASEEDELLQFNVNSKTLGTNAKLLLELLESKINDLDTYRLKLDLEGFPKLTLKADARDRILAKDFFNSLWFYTNQAKENEIESHGKEILEDYCITTKQTSDRSSVRYDAIYFKIHDEVQKWWMAERESYYLTNDRQFFDDILKELLENSLLTNLSCVYVKRTKSYGIEFNEAAVRALCTQFGADCTVVLTEVIKLTGIKLVQHFQTLNDYAFIELDSFLLLSRNDRNVLKYEIKNKKLKTLIIIYEDVSESKSDLLHYLIKETTSQQLIIVTPTHSYEKLHTYFVDDREFVKVCDDRTEFSDLVPMSQEKILSNKLIFQGTETAFNTVIQEDANYLLTPFILQKIINNEKIEVGRTISNSNYEEIKDYYVDRQLSIVKESNKELISEALTERMKAINKLFPRQVSVRKQIVNLNTFEDIHGTVILIGAAGSGKSSYLTHMSIKTKQRNPKVWIERINLLDYTREFHRWHENKINIDRIEALKFICKAAVVCQETSKNNFNDIFITLEVNNGVLVLRNCEARNSSVAFELEMFIYCYNKGNTVLLFDGFDEICPHYKDEIIAMLKCLVKRSSGVNLADETSDNQRIWIASRSYNNIITTLKSEFGAPYDLIALTEAQLKTSMKKFFKINLKLHELNYDQFMKIDEFFDYMKTNGDFYPKKRRNKMFKYSTFLLHILYSTAVEYFQSEIDNIHFRPETHYLAEKWRSINKFKVHISDLLRVNAYSLMSLHCKNEMRREKAMTMAITPLHMYVALDYFIHEIKDAIPRNNNTVSKWNLETNTSSFYQYFLEIKYKRIRYEQKNQMNLCNPDVKITCERGLKEYLDKHKKIAFYATFIEESDEILTQVEINEMQKIIKEFETAEEKTGVVDYIVNGVPKFIHLTFQEYLTAEYITDLLKTKPKEDQLDLWKFIVRYVSEGVLEFFDRKFEYDDELKNLTLSDEVKQTVFYEVYLKRHCKSAAKETFNKRRLLNIVDDAVTIDLRYITKFFIKVIVDVIHEENLNDFLRFLTNYCLFNNIASEGWNDILIIILDCIRNIDPGKLEVFNYGITSRDFTNFSNEDIIRDVNTEMNAFSRLVVQRRYYCKLNEDCERGWEST